MKAIGSHALADSFIEGIAPGKEFQNWTSGFQGEVRGLVCALFATMFALRSCVFQSRDITVSANTIASKIATDLTIWIDDQDHRTSGDYRMMALERAQSKILSHVSSLIHGDRFFFQGYSHGSVAYSYLDTTVYYLVVLDKQCFDPLDRPFAISKGRITVDGSFRNLALEDLNHFAMGETERTEMLQSSLTTWPTGMELTSHYRPGLLQVRLHIFQKEYATIIRFTAERSSEEQHQTTELGVADAYRISSMIPHGPPCPHDRSHGFAPLEAQRKIQVATFDGLPFHRAPKAVTMVSSRATSALSEDVFFALAENPLEQLFLPQIQGEDVAAKISFQGESCLECIYKSSCSNDVSIIVMQ